MATVLSRPQWVSNSFFKCVASYNTNIATRYDTVLIVNSYVNSDSYVPLMSMRCWYFGEKKTFYNGSVLSGECYICDIIGFMWELKILPHTVGREVIVLPREKYTKRCISKRDVWLAGMRYKEYDTEQRSAYACICRGWCWWIGH